jgi:hypothetical protein
MPLTAFAYGEEVLTTFFLEFVTLVIFVIGLLTINLNRKGKLIIGGIYILATTLTFSLINNLPYNQYRTMINIVVVVAPLTIVLIGYVSVKNRFKRNDGKHA